MQTGDSSVLVHLGENLRRLRRDRGMSQEALAQASGISRRTIINLEAGETNVSLVALDRLAGALDATFTDLVVERTEHAEPSAPSAPSGEVDVVVWRGADPASIGRLVGAAPARAEAQVLAWELAAGERYDAEPDPAGWHEIVLVASGSVRLLFDGGVDGRLLTSGEHALFSSAQRYGFEQVGDAPARLLRVVLS
ncbi:XRE family transcriptional regulator [Leifsonia sp. NPDC080035]|uniref:XRE family transcriptional regulator n=1 Tax=Leifsonia sp. NPDC080035 TaxID=3143936 RepID=A0AAU7GF92_9MICO